VRSTSDGKRFVEKGGRRYFSTDLPFDGTDVEVDTYTGIGDTHEAIVTWSCDTPSGQSCCLAVEYWGM
jgi:hypothetical protein